MMTLEEFKSEIDKATVDLSTYDKAMEAHKKISEIYGDHVDFMKEDAAGNELNKFKYALGEKSKVEDRLDAFCRRG